MRQSPQFLWSGKHITQINIAHNYGSVSLNPLLLNEDIICFHILATIENYVCSHIIVHLDIKGSLHTSSWSPMVYVTAVSVAVAKWRWPYLGRYTNFSLSQFPDHIHPRSLSELAGWEPSMLALPSSCQYLTLTDALQWQGLEQRQVLVILVVELNLVVRTVMLVWIKRRMLWRPKYDCVKTIILTLTTWCNLAY